MILWNQFLSLFTVFLNTGANAPRAPYFLTVLIERNTLPLTGAWGGWVVGGLGGGWLAGGWLLGMDHWFRYTLPPGLGREETRKWLV